MASRGVADARLTPPEGAGALARSRPKWGALATDENLATCELDKRCCGSGRT